LVSVLLPLAFAAECLPQEPAQLRDEELLKRAAFEAQAFAKADAALAADRDALAAGADPLRAALAALAAELPPAPPDPLSRTTISEADLEEVAARHEEYVAALARKAQAQGECVKLAEARGKLLLAAIDKVKAVETAAASAGPVLMELRRRAAAGAIAPDRIALDEKQRSLEEFLARIDANSKGLAAIRAGFEEEAKRVEQQRKELAAVPAPSAPSAEVVVAGLLIEALRMRAAELEELGRADAATLPGAVARLAEEGRRAGEARAAARAAVDAAREDLEALDRATAALVLPDRDAVPEGEGHAELRAARREAGFASAMVAYGERRLAAMAQARQAAARLDQALKASAEAEGAAARQAVKIWAAVALAEERKAAGALEAFEPPAGATPRELEALVRGTATARARDRKEAAALAERLSATENGDAAQKDVQAARQDLARAEAVMKEEETYATHLVEMAARTPEELASLLAPEGELARSLASAAAAADEAVKAREAAESKARGRRDVIATIENPYTMAGLRQAKARAAEIEKEIEALRDGQLPADREATPLGLPLEGPAEPPDGVKDVMEAGAAMKRSIEEEQALAKEIVRFFADMAQAVADWKGAAAASDEAAARAEQMLSALVNQEKRKYACARELERRYNAGAIPRGRLGDLAKAGTRDAIRAAVARRDAIVKEQETIQARRAEEAQRLDALALLAASARARSETANRKAALIGQPISHLTAAKTAFEDLPEADRKGIGFRAATLRGGDEGMLERLFVSWTPVQGRERFEEPLQAWYVELALGARRASELASAVAAYEEIIGISTAYREEIADAPEALRAAALRRAEDYRVARYLAAIAASPESRTQIETAFRAAYKRELPYPVDTRGWSKQIWAENLFTAEARLYGQRNWLRETERLLSKLGIEAEIGRYRQQLARISADVEINAAHGAKVGEDVERLWDAYRSAALRDLLVALAQILVVPILAWLFLRLVRRSLHRIEKRVAESAAPDLDDRRRRVSTIARVSGAAITVTVWVVACVYILATMGVSVTPIVASAGVVGFAVAFGAQALIRDFLSGLFILLENQYKIGDIVDVGGVAGVVERISLRVTVLRDLEGAVHYVPNGTLSRVANKTQGWSRTVVDVGISYRDDIDRATGVLQETLTKLRQDPPWKFWILEDPVIAGVESLADSCVHLRVMVKTRPGKQWDMGRELRRRIKYAFDAAGIEIPFPQRVVHHIREEPADPVSDGKGRDGPASETARR